MLNARTVKDWLLKEGRNVFVAGDWLSSSHSPRGGETAVTVETMTILVSRLDISVFLVFCFLVFLHMSLRVEVEAIALRVEAIGWRPSLLGWTIMSSFSPPPLRLLRVVPCFKCSVPSCSSDRQYRAVMDCRASDLAPAHVQVHMSEQESERRYRKNTEHMLTYARTHAKTYCQNN